MFDSSIKVTMPNGDKLSLTNREVVEFVEASNKWYDDAQDLRDERDALWEDRAKLQELVKSSAERLELANVKLKAFGHPGI